MRPDLQRPISLVAFMLALLLVLAVVAPGFLSLANLRDIPINASHVAIAALGMLLLIVIGQIDVSVGAILAICATLCGLAAKAGWGAAEIALMSAAAGGALGFVNGALVTTFSVHSIVVTLGMLSIYRGLLIFFTGGTWIYDLPASFGAIGQGTLMGIPNPVIVTILLYVAGGFLLANTRVGRELFAVGSNPHAARLAGVSITRIQLLAFTLNGVLVGIAALLFASRFTVIQSNAGMGFEFAVITAVVVGGASIFGGSGTVLGTLLGALVISFASTALVFLGVSSLWEQAMMGGFVLAAVLLDRVRFFDGLRRLRDGAPS
ncbi:MAG: ABC transporter permease [Rhizobiaceae bacterium]|nr:ABC transporter permease [Rhizobiaceae bacterium]